MAMLDLWFEGEWGREPINWHEGNVPFDLDRYHYDQRYSNLINAHVKNALEYLAKELSEISLTTPTTDGVDINSCD